MKPFIYFKEIIVLLLLMLSLVFNSCKCQVEEVEPLAYNYMNVPEGDTAIVENLNIAGMGARKNNRGTTWIIKGHVVFDHLQVLGNVILEEDSRLTVLGKLEVAKEGKVVVNSELRYAELKQSGTIVYHKK